MNFQIVGVTTRLARAGRTTSIGRRPVRSDQHAYQHNYTGRGSKLYKKGHVFGQETEAAARTAGGGDDASMGGEDLLVDTECQERIQHGRCYAKNKVIHKLSGQVNPSQVVGTSLGWW